MKLGKRYSAEASPNAYTHRSNGHSKQFEKPARKFEPSLSLLRGMDESVQLNPNGILYAKIVIDEFVEEISLMLMRMASSKARTTTGFENGPCMGPAASLIEMMMQLEISGKWISEEVRQLQLNDLVWIIDENVKKAHYKM